MKCRGKACEDRISCDTCDKQLCICQEEKARMILPHYNFDELVWCLMCWNRKREGE